MKGLIITNPYDYSLANRRKVGRMVSEFENLKVSTEVVANDKFLAYLDNGKAKADVRADFALYFDKDRYVAQLLEMCGIRVFNSSQALAVCDDKMQTHIALANCGIPMPTTLAGTLCYNPRGKLQYSYLKQAADTLDFPLVVKECYGSYGEQVYLAKTMDELVLITERIKFKPYIFQQFAADSAGKDMRVIVIGGKTVCGMIRQSVNGDFRSNTQLGGKAAACDVPRDIALLCERVSKIIGLDYCGVDILLSSAPMVCEVNSNAMFNAMEQSSGVNVARKYCEHIIRTVNNA